VGSIASVRALAREPAERQLGWWSV
jgi:hypothetical protein